MKMNLNLRGLLMQVFMPLTERQHISLVENPCLEMKEHLLQKQKQNCKTFGRTTSTLLSNEYSMQAKFFFMLLS